MYIVENYKGLQIVWLKSECTNKADEMKYIYDPEAKVFLMEKRGRVPLQMLYADLLADGTSSAAYKAALTVRDFFFLHEEFMQTVEPKFKVDDICMDIGYSNTGRIYKSVRILGIDNVRRTVSCSSDGEQHINLTIRYKVEDTKTGEVNFREESSLFSLEELPGEQNQDRLFKEVRKLMRTLGTQAFGVTLVFKGKAYRF